MIPNTSLINGNRSDVISIQDRALHYGDGVFETIAILHGKPLCWDAHIARLSAACRYLQIPFDDYALLADESQTLSSSQQRAVLKISITRGISGRGYRGIGSNKPNRIVALFDWPSYPAEYSSSGVAAQICQTRYGDNAQLAGIKHLNRLEQVLASNEITDSAIAEGIVLDQTGKLIEGTMTNIFLKVDNEILTPDISRCGIAGIIRQYILDQQAMLGLKIRCAEVSIEQLFKASAIFLCNSIIGVWPVNRIDAQHYSDLTLGRQVARFLIDQHVIAAN